MKYGFTALEIESLSRGYSKRRKRSELVWDLIVLVMFLASLVYIVRLAMTVPFAEAPHASAMSSYEQEKAFCLSWANGTEVLGAPREVVAKHCKEYGV